MNKSFSRILAAVLATFLLLSCIGITSWAAETADEVECITMLRLYNPNTGEHFYTGSEEERDNLVAVGWQYEGKAWEAPVSTGEPVYRMYNPNAGDHHYTMSEKERDDLKKAGWNYEGVAWNSHSNKGVAHYRLYNPHVYSRTHHYTASVQELNNLLDNYWEYEGVAFYGYAPDHEHAFDKIEGYWNADNADAGCTVLKCECGVRKMEHHANTFVMTKLPTQNNAGIKVGKCVCGEGMETKEIPAGTYDVFSGEPIYFANENEYNLLYSINPDGSCLQLVLDERCVELWYSDGRVLYQTFDDELIAYDITAQVATKLDAVIDYDEIAVCSIDGIHAYYLARTDDSQVSPYHHNLETGEMNMISPQQGGYVRNYSISGGYGRLYFVESVYTRDVCEYLYAYDPETKQYTLIDSSGSIDDLVAVDGGVVYVKTDREGLEPSRQYCYTTADGSETRIIKDQNPYMSSILYADENGVVYEYGASIYYLSVNGEETCIASRDDGWLNVYNVGSDRFLLEYVQYDTFCSTYYLFDAGFFSQTQTLIPLDTKDKLANMFADGDFPLIDSSTARKPLTGMLYNLFVERQGHRGTEPVCSTTHGAWLNIADRKADLAFLAAPTEEEQAYLDEKGVEIDMKLYAGDALAFIVNSKNPVKNLTHQQIIDIYTGKITNWSEVGGPDHIINVYYRDDQSGSQRLFESIVFKGLELPDYEALGFEFAGDMFDIVDEVGWDPYGIGYSIMTYLNDSYYDMEELQILAVNGVEPTAKTVMDESYPYGTKGYIVIRSDEPEDSPARRLYDWFGCKASDEILIDNGITPLKEKN